MGINLPHALGRNQKFFVVPEVTFDTFVKPTSANAAKILGSSFEFTHERTDRMDSRQTRSYLERITRRKNVNWNANSYLLPSGSPGVAPDMGELLKACMGEETIVGGTSVAYTLQPGQTDLSSVVLIREMNQVIMEAITGCWVEQFTINVSGTDEPKITFEGGAADHTGTGTGVAQGTVDGTITPVGAVTVDTGEGVNFDVDSVIQIGTDDNSAAGFLVTDVTGDVVTFSPDLITDQGASPEVVPFAPVETTAGSPIALILGSITVDGEALPITSFELTCKNNVKPLNDEAFQAEAVSDFIPGFRDVTGNMTVRLRKDATIFHFARKNFVTRDLFIQIGETVGSRLKIDIDFAEFDLTALEVPESEEATFTLPFKALGSSGEDELTLTFD